MSALPSQTKKILKRRRKRRNMKKVFATKFNAACLVLIPACIGINYIGKMFAQLLKLPLWLDCIGTGIGACLGGPIIGGIAGGLTNVIYSVTAADTITLVYSLTSLAIGVAVGIMARLGFMKRLAGAIATACVAGMTAVAVSTPLNIIFWEGMTGNVWGDALFAWTQNQGMPLALGSFLDEVVVDVPDKLLVILIVFLIMKGLPKTVHALYESDDTIEELD